MGGIFKGRAWMDSDQVEHAFMMVWGELSRDPQIKCVNKPKVEFGLKYHRKMFVNCVAWGETDTSTVMAALERGDTVLCIGQWEKREYTNKKGEKKDWSELTCEIIIPMSLIRHTLRLYSSTFLKRMINSEDRIPDPMESAHDHRYSYPSKPDIEVDEEDGESETDESLPF